MAFYLIQKHLQFTTLLTIHNPLNDKGVLWNSIAFNWPVKNPLLSKRDLNHPSIKEVKCEFS